jgi:hypothetical protein
MVLPQIRTPARTWPDAEKINIAMLCTLVFSLASTGRRVNKNVKKAAVW